jgi:hypothetical protein
MVIGDQPPADWVPKCERNLISVARERWHSWVATNDARTGAWNMQTPMPNGAMWRVLLVALLINSGAHAADIRKPIPTQSVNTVADTQDSARRQGVINIGGINWACSSTHCSTSTMPSAVAAPVAVCQGLARMVGAIRHFEVANRPLNGDELQRCNSVVPAKVAAMPGMKPPTGAGSAPATQTPPTSVATQAPVGSGMTKSPSAIPQTPTKSGGGLAPQVATPPSAPHRPATKDTPLEAVSFDLCVSYIAAPRVVVRGGKIAFLVVDANVTNLGKNNWSSSYANVVHSELLDGLPTRLADGRPVRRSIALGDVRHPVSNLRAGFAQRVVAVYGAAGQIALPTEPAAWQPQAGDAAFAAFGLGRTYTLTVGVLGDPIDQRAENNVRMIVFYVDAGGTVSDLTMYSLIDGKLDARDVGSRRPATAPPLGVSQEQLRADIINALKESARLYRLLPDSKGDKSKVGGAMGSG